MVMAPYFFIHANRNKAEPMEVTKQVVWVILRHWTIRYRTGFPSYARALCALTLPAYALKKYAFHNCENYVNVSHDHGAYPDRTINAHFGLNTCISDISCDGLGLYTSESGNNGKGK